MIAPALSGQTDRRRGLAAVSVMLATIMQAVDTTIANVALPHMQGALGGTQDQIAWVLTSYIVAAAICMPLTGLLAARFGRKRVFMTAVAGFTMASMLCGAAQNLSQIVLFRLLQGVFGACLVPLSQAVMLDSYPPHRRAEAMAMWGMGVMIGPIVGPMLGGWLTEHYNWRWVFYINLPVGVLAWLGLAAFVPETEIDPERRFDMLGFCFLCLGLGSLQIIFNIFRQKPIRDLFDKAMAQNVGIIVRLPLASGLLAGKFTGETKFAKDDHRNYNADGNAFNVGETFAGLPLAKGAELAELIKALVPEGMTMAQFSQRWILDHDAVSTVITGASQPSHDLANTAVSELPRLSKETHSQLAAIYESSIQEHIRGLV